MRRSLNLKIVNNVYCINCFQFIRFTFVYICKCYVINMFELTKKVMTNEGFREFASFNFSVFTEEYYYYCYHYIIIATFLRSEFY